MNEKCALGCGRPLNPHDAGVWKEVIGFVGGPKQDSMRLRQDTGRYAHNACVGKLMEGQSIDQPALFSEGTIGTSDSGEENGDSPSGDRVSGETL